MKQLNEQQIVEKWSPMIEKATGLKENAKLNWISKYAHYHALNEAAMGGVSSPYSTLLNVPGVGNAQPAAQAPVTGAGFASDAAKGSGDKWPALLPMSLQVAARTVGFDIVNVVPMPGPTGVVSYLDYVYAGGKQPYGAAPGTKDNPNPDANSISKFEAPHAFKLKIEDASAKADLEKGDVVTFADQASGSTAAVTATYIGKGRIDGYAMFKVGEFTDAENLADVFSGNVEMTNGGTTATVTVYPSLISTLEDQVQGYAGAGPKNDEDWAGTFMDGTQLYEPMERGIGEQEYPKALGLSVFTKFVQVGTYQVSVSVTQEQIQDLNKQWGIDVIAMVENAGINEISQSINKHILSRVFGLGWKNHIAANDVEAINLNLNVTSASGLSTKAYAYPDGETGATGHAAMEIPDFHVYAPAGVGTYENQDTIIKRIMANVIAAGNVVMQRGRRGPANFIVTNIKIATAMQTNAQYGFSPLANTFNQNKNNYG